MSMKYKFQVTVKKMNAVSCERKIIEEIKNDMEKYFNVKDDSHTNHQVNGMRELLRELLAKE